MTEKGEKNCKRRRENMTPSPWSCDLLKEAELSWLYSQFYNRQISKGRRLIDND